MGTGGKIQAGHGGWRLGRSSPGGDLGQFGINGAVLPVVAEVENSRPNHPTTCGKVERFQQTMKKWLLAQPVRPTTIAGAIVLASLPQPDCRLSVRHGPQHTAR
jgi:hypothetical protein